MDDDADRRLQKHIYPRPPEEVIDTCVLWGFRKPEEQTWIRGDDFHAERPRPSRCGFHTIDPGPVEVVDLAGVDGKTYRAGQCRLCGRIFWGVKGERPKRDGR